MNNTIGRFTIWLDRLDQMFLNLGMSEGLTIFVRTFLVLLVLVDLITKNILLRGIKSIVKKTKTRLDDILIGQRVFHRVSHIVPALLVYFTASMVFRDYPVLEEVIERASLIYIVIVVILSIDSFINALHEIYLSMPVSEGRPIKGYIQVVKIIIYFIGIILMIAIPLVSRLSRIGYSVPDDCHYRQGIAEDTAYGTGGHGCRDDAGIQGYHTGICGQYSTFGK